VIHGIFEIDRLTDFGGLVYENIGLTDFVASIRNKRNSYRTFCGII
jgi:hypothetical protein